MASLEDVFAEAARNGIEDEVKALHAIAVKHGLHVSVSVKNIICSARPPSYGTSDGSVLYSVGIKPKVEGRVHVLLRSTAFAQFFPIDALEVRKTIGDDGSYNMDAKRVKIFAEEMDALFAKIHAR